MSERPSPAVVEADGEGFAPLLRLAMGCSGASGAVLWLERNGSLELRATAWASGTTGSAEAARAAATARLARPAAVAGEPWRAVRLPGAWPAALSLLAPALDDAPGGLATILEALAAHLALAENLAVTERDWRHEFALVQRISGVGSWSWDMTTQAVRWSEKMFYLLGTTPDAETPTLEATFARIAAEDRCRLKTAIADACWTGRHFSLEHDIVHATGARRTVAAQGRIVPSRDGPGQRVIVTVQDLTDQIRMARDLEAARARAELQAETKTRLLAHISHEIRTPLNAVLGFAGLLAQTGLDHQQRRHLGVIRETGELLLSVVNDLLDLAKIEAGRISIEKIAFAVGPLLQAARATTEVLLGTKDVRFVLDQAQDVPAWLLGDPIRIKQILTNLLGNAAKFTSTGTITLRVFDVAPAGMAGRLRFEIVDTGIGVPAEHRDQLFRRFVQLGEDTNRRFGGTGLGLAICRELVELMEGTIGIASRPGAGSTFWFELPLPAAAPEEAPAGEPPAASVRPLGVLVVDDVETNRQLIQALLELNHHRVRTAKDGLEAIAAVQESPPDIVLMDINMPELDGLAATRAIRGLGGRLKELPIIAMTARALPADVAACLAAGMNGYLAKPIDPQRLAQALTEAAPQAPPVTAAAPPAAPVLVLAQLQGLAASLGVEATRSLFLSMLARVEGDCAAMAAGLGREEHALVRDAAHRLAGLCGSLGAPSLSRVAQAIERAAEERRLAACPPLLDELRALARAAAAEFADAFGPPAAPAHAKAAAELLPATPPLVT